MYTCTLKENFFIYKYFKFIFTITNILFYWNLEKYLVKTILLALKSVQILCGFFSKWIRK